MKLAYDCRVFPKYTLGQLICFSICGHVPSLVGLKPRELLIDLVYTCSMTTMITTMKDSGLPSTWLRARSLTLPSWLLPHHREITLMLGILTSKDLVSVKIYFVDMNSWLNFLAFGNVRVKALLTLIYVYQMARPL